MVKRRAIFYILSLAVFLGLLASRAIYRYFFLMMPESSNLANRVTELKIRSLAKEMSLPTGTTGKGGYDFKRMVRIIDLSNRIQSEASEFTSQSHGKKAIIDQPMIHSVIQELITERRRLRDYIWDLKGLSRVSMSTKKHRNILYYLEVIDNCIDNMRALKQVNPQSSQQENEHDDDDD